MVFQAQAVTDLGALLHVYPGAGERDVSERTHEDRTERGIKGSSSILMLQFWLQKSGSRPFPFLTCILNQFHEVFVSPLQMGQLGLQEQIIA